MPDNIGARQLLLTCDVIIDCHFFESSHCKSSADCMPAVVKLSMLLKIRNADEFYEFCEKNLKHVGDGVFQSEIIRKKDSHSNNRGGKKLN